MTDAGVGVGDTGATVLVGLDVGSTRLKAVVVDRAGIEVGSATGATPWVASGDHVEMDAEVLADAARDTVARALADTARTVPKPHVAGVGVTGVGESGVLLDRHGVPSAPIIAWHDRRGDVDAIARRLPDLSVRTGVVVDPTATIFKLPLLLATGAGCRWLNVPEWIVHSLGGEQFAETSLAGRTGLQDLHTGAWWPDALAAIGCDESLLPGQPAIGTEGAGTASFPPIAGATLAVAGHDHQTAALAVDAIGAGRLFRSLGTADAMAQTVDLPVDASVVTELTAASVSVGRTVVADRAMAMTGLRTGVVLNRVARLLGVESSGDRRAVAERAARLPDAGGVEVSLTERGVSIAGIGDDAKPEQLWRAAVDAAEHQAGVVVDRLARLLGACDDVVVGGGWLGDPAIAAAVARRFPTARHAGFAEPGAVGAAAVAGIAAGVITEPFAQRVTTQTTAPTTASTET